MKFEVTFNEQLGLWQYRTLPNGVLSELMTSNKVAACLRNETKLIDEQTDKSKGWNMPLPHQVKKPKRSVDIVDMTRRYEVVGGKVQRIPFDAAERQKQQIDTILALFDAEDEANG